MRDRRFVAAHRGGPLELADHRLLAAWAADCAEHLLPLFALHSADDRPRHAIEIGRAWARGEVKTGVAQRASVAAHAAARQATDPTAIAVARAAGHAVATAHFADHSLGPVLYGAKAVAAAGGSVDEERAWQCARIPEPVRALVLSALASHPRFAALLAAIEAQPGGLQSVWSPPLGHRELRLSRVQRVILVIPPPPSRPHPEGTRPPKNQHPPRPGPRGAGGRGPAGRSVGPQRPVAKPAPTSARLVP